MLQKINQDTKTHRLLNALQNGEKFTASQANKRFGIKNLRAEASRIRNAGYVVYVNSRKAANGVQVTEYELGKPSRRVIAAGQKAIRLGLF